MAKFGTFLSVVVNPSNTIKIIDGKRGNLGKLARFKNYRKFTIAILKGENASEAWDNIFGHLSTRLEVLAMDNFLRIFHSELPHQTRTLGDGINKLEQLIKDTYYLQNGNLKSKNPVEHWIVDNDTNRIYLTLKTADRNKAEKMASDLNKKAKRERYIVRGFGVENPVVNPKKKKLDAFDDKHLTDWIENHYNRSDWRTVKSNILKFLAYSPSYDYGNNGWSATVKAAEYVFDNRIESKEFVKWKNPKQTTRKPKLTQSQIDSAAIALIRLIVNEKDRDKREVLYKALLKLTGRTQISTAEMLMIAND